MYVRKSHLLSLEQTQTYSSLLIPRRVELDEITVRLPTSNHYNVDKIVDKLPLVQFGIPLEIFENL
jgi:hypothetical protein